MASEPSAIPMPPVAVVLAALAMVRSAGVTLTVVSVEAGKRQQRGVSSWRPTAPACRSSWPAARSAAVGTRRGGGGPVHRLGALSAAGRAIASSRTTGARLLYNERVTR